jgi:hypothetical protein
MKPTRRRKTTAVVPRSLLAGVSMGAAVIPFIVSCGDSGEAPVVIYPAMDFDAGNDAPTTIDIDAGNDAEADLDAASDAPPVVIYPAMDFDAGDSGMGQ